MSVIELSPCAHKRAALYAVDDEDGVPQPTPLLACAAHAKRLGYRVVVMSQEVDGSVNPGMGGPGLRALVDRLSVGEFDVIVASSAASGLITIEPVHSYGRGPQ